MMSGPSTLLNCKDLYFSEMYFCPGALLVNNVFFSPMHYREEDDEPLRHPQLV